MATITNDEQFVIACSWLIDNGQLAVQGARFIDRAARKVFDERVGGNVDITPNTATLESALDSANAQLTVASSEATQAASAKSTLQALMTGLSGLSAQDKGYVVLGRIFAQNDGANNATIMAITTRAQATTYVTGRANWLAVPSAARPMLGDMLEAQAKSLSVIIALLT